MQIFHTCVEMIIGDNIKDKMYSIEMRIFVCHT